MSKKIFLVMATTIVVGTLLSACGSAATPTEAVPVATTAPVATTGVTAAPTEKPTAEAVDLVWWQLAGASGNTDWINAFTEIISSYEKAHPGVIITLETRSIDAQKDALRTAAGTDAFPDIYFMWSGLGLGGEFVKAGASAPLDAYYAKYGWDKILVPAAVAASKQYGDGHNHGIMSEVHGQALYYRKDLFTKAGITSVPTTYADLIADNEKLLKIGVSPIEFGGTVNWHLMRLLDNLLETKCGTATHDQLKSMTASWATTACVADAFTELKLWSDKYIAPGFIAIDNNEASQEFYTGKAAMALEGDWFVGDLTAAKVDLSQIGVFPFPNGTGRLYSFAQGNYIASNSKHKDVAADFLNYFVSVDVQSKYLGTWGTISVNMNVKPPADQPDVAAAWTKIFSGATGSYQNADQAFPLDVTTEYWRIQNLVATDSLDPTKAGAEFQKFIDNRAK
jgi:raffinose/stachyose/melibiose transport system substrate-binding protein